MHEGFCKAFGFVKTQQQHAAEYLQDGRGVQGRKRQKRSICGESSIGNNCVAVGVEVGAIGAEVLKRIDTAGADILSVQQRLNGLQYGSIGGLRQQTQQRGLALEQPALHSRDGKGPVAVRDGGENLGRKFFCKQKGAFGLTAGAEISGAARICRKMLLPTFGAADAREAPLKPPECRTMNFEPQKLDRATPTPKFNIPCSIFCGSKRSTAVQPSWHGRTGIEITSSI